MVKPSLAFWRWLVGGPPCPPEKGWQVRGGLKLSATEILGLLGPQAAAAVADGSVRVDNASVSGPETQKNTPLIPKP